MKRRFALKASSLAAIGLTASINGGCSKNIFRFNHGVASGDPSSDQVMLWTRVTPEQPGPIKVILEVSSSSDFNNIAFTKSLKTSSLSDYTVKYDLSIKDIFQSGETFYYRFSFSFYEQQSCLGCHTKQVHKLTLCQAEIMYKTSRLGKPMTEDQIGTISFSSSFFWRLKCHL